MLTKPIKRQYLHELRCTTT